MSCHIWGLNVLNFYFLSKSDFTYNKDPSSLNLIHFCFFLSIENSGSFSVEVRVVKIRILHVLPHLRIRCAKLLFHFRKRFYIPTILHCEIFLTHIILCFMSIKNSELISVWIWVARISPLPRMRFKTSSWKVHYLYWIRVF